MPTWRTLGHHIERHEESQIQGNLRRLLGEPCVLGLTAMTVIMEHVNTKRMGGVVYGKAALSQKSL